MHHPLIQRKLLKVDLPQMGESSLHDAPQSEVLGKRKRTAQPREQMQIQMQGQKGEQYNSTSGAQLACQLQVRARPQACEIAFLAQKAIMTVNPNATVVVCTAQDRVQGYVLGAGTEMTGN